MNIHCTHRELIRTIQESASQARDARQVKRRLRSVLPARLQDLTRRGDSTVARAQRVALTDPRYQSYLEEIAEIGHQSLASRVNYETHMMLHDARRSFNRLQRLRANEMRSQ